MITPEAQEEIEKEPREFSGIVDVMVDVLATLIANIEALTVDRVVDELTGIFTDEEAQNQFVGRLKETVEQKGEARPDELAIGETTEVQPVAPAPAQPVVQTASKKTQAKKEKLKKLLLARKREIEELGGELQHREDQITELKDTVNAMIRSPRVKRVAQQMAELYEKDEKDFFKELLVLSDEEFEKKETDVQTLHDKLASKKEEKKEVVGSLLQAVPSQVTEPEHERKTTFGWNTPPKV